MGRQSQRVPTPIATKSRTSPRDSKFCLTMRQPRITQPKFAPHSSARGARYDVLIAGHARSRGLVVVTGNRGELDRVDGLRCEDWG